MSTDTPDLDTLRIESQQIGSRITRLCIILIGLLAIVTFTVTNALHKVDRSGLQQDRDRTEQLRDILVNSYLRKNAELTKQQPAAESEEEKREKKKLDDELEKARNEANEAQRKYTLFLEESFSINPSLLGSGLRIDLRTWIYIIPFMLLMTFIYVQILRKKQATLAIIASSLLANKTETSKVGRLTFSERPGIVTPFTSHPFQLEQAIYLLVILILFSLIIIALSDAEMVLLGLSAIQAVQYLLMFLTVGFYGSSYYYHVASSLDKQSVAITEWSATPNVFMRASMKLRASTNWLVSRIRPKISLTTGSLLILTSLFLATSASCDMNGDDVRLPGYRLLQEPGGKFQHIDWASDQFERLVKGGPGGLEAVDKSWQDPGGGWWVSTVMQPKWGGLYWRTAIHNLGRFAYALSLILAVFTTFLVLSTVRRSKLWRMQKLREALFLCSTTISLIIVTDFSFNTFWFKDEIFILSNLFWIIPSGLLFRLVLSNRRKSLDVSKTIAFLVTLVLPLVVCATIYVVYITSYGFIGVLAYFVGINLLSLTYLELVRADRRRVRDAPDCPKGEPTNGGT